MKLFPVLVAVVVTAGCGRGEVSGPVDPTQGGIDQNNDDDSNNTPPADQPSNPPGNPPSDPPSNPPNNPPPVDPIAPIFPKDGFCNEGGVSWGWCEDFDGQGMSGPVAFNPASSGIARHVHSHMRTTGLACETSGDCSPYVQGGSLFLNAEDGGFAMEVLRVEQPFDFESRTGHVHYRSSMQGHPRMHQDIHITPEISNTLPDLRFVEKPLLGNAIDIDYIGDGGWPFTVVVWKNGAQVYLAHANGPFGITPGVQQDIDVYVSRQRVRVLLGNNEVFDSSKHVNEDDNVSPFPDIGFTRGYVTFSQLAYNPAKDGYPGDAANTFLWDNLAFDGPSLPKNSLTPIGKKEVLFRAWNKSACSVRGIEADGPIVRGWFFNTWHVQIGANDPPVTASDLNCVFNLNESGQPDMYPPPDGTPYSGGDIEIVTR